MNIVFTDREIAKFKYTIQQFVAMMGNMFEAKWRDEQGDTIMFVSTKEEKMGTDYKRVEFPEGAISG